MKISLIPALLLMLVFCSYASDSRGQKLLDKKVNLQLVDEEMRNVFTALEKQIDAKFVYSPEIIGASRKVSVEAKDKQLSKVLSDLLEALNINYELVDNYIVLSKKTGKSPGYHSYGTIPDNSPYAYVKIGGRVVNSTGQPLEGVSVVVKGTNIGTTTNANGEFSLNVPDPQSTLVVSYIGYQGQEIPVADKTYLPIALTAENSQLNDVVVVGYGTVKKSDLTGSVGVVNVGNVEKVATYDVARSLQGQVAGVTVQGSGEPGGFVNIKIRGISSLNDNNPLFVIDGVPIVNEAPYDFPMDDIESIQVLKDASAGAIYGSRAAAGVIIITTKKGRSGPVRVKYSGYIGAQNMPKTLPLTNRQQYQQITTQAEKNAGLPIAAANDPSNAAYISNTNTDWQKAAFKTGVIQDHNLNFSGGTEATSYSMSLNYFDQSATIKGGPGEPKYNRYNANASIQSKAGILSFGGRFAFTESHKQNITYPHLHPNIGNEIVDLDRAIPTVPVNDPKRLGGFGGTDEVTQKAIVLNVIGMNNLMNSYSDRNRFLGNSWLELEPVKNLKYRLNLVYDRTETRDLFFEPQYDLGWYYLNNTAYLTDSRGAQYTALVENTLSYKFTLGQHRIDLLAGTTYEKDDLQNMTGLESGFNPPYYLSFGTGDPTTASVTSGEQRATMSSFLGRINYNYGDRYLITVNARRDGSSKFSPEHRWGNFGSVAGAWNISNEKFIHLPDAVSFLKLRGGYGTLGNQNFPSYYAYTTYINSNASYLFGNTPGSGNQYLAPGSIQTQVADPTLKWETKTTSNLALDLGLLNNTLLFTAEYFVNTDKDLIAQPPIPLSVGATNTPYVNAASLRNSGIEFTVTYHKTFGKLALNIEANAHTLKNKVLQLGGTNDPIYGAESKTEVGHEVGQIYGYVTEGIFQNTGDIQKHAIQPNAAPGDLKFRDIDGNDTINALDQTYLGSAIPKLYYGLNLSLSYGAWDASVFFQGNEGNKIVNGLYQTLMAGQYTNHYIDELNYWTPTHANTNVPRPVIGDPNGNDGPSDRWVQSGTYVKLQNAQLGYNFPTAKLNRTHVFKSIRVYVSGQNLLTLTKYKGYDPDIISDGLFSRGFDYGSFPNPRSYMVGLQVGF
ncbi:TonB-dependent receptor [Puia sp.]|uniref:TonB-dependent receptor n=1 Tax=Puia sp. TaxID=2045100 RepID=UPI002F41B980